MAPGSHVQQSPCNNLPADFIGEQNKLVSPQDPAKRANAGSDKAPTLLEALTLSFIPLTKDLFTKFIKAFVESIQAWDQE